MKVAEVTSINGNLFDIRLVESRHNGRGSGARLHLTVCDEDDAEYHFDHDGHNQPPPPNGG